MSNVPAGGVEFTDIDPEPSTAHYPRLAYQVRSMPPTVAMRDLPPKTQMRVQLQSTLEFE